MTEHIRILSTLLEEILDRELSTEADFATLAATGEQLRRAVQMLDERAEQMIALMRRYDARIANFEDQHQSSLSENLNEVVADLDHYMSTERDPLVGQDLLLALDDALSIASALTRTGHLAEADVGALAEQAATAIASRASRLPELWQFAEDREFAFGPDEQSPQLFAFWDELASFAATRTATFTAANALSADARQQIVNRFLEHAAPLPNALIDPGRDLEAMRTPATSSLATVPKQAQVIALCTVRPSWFQPPLQAAASIQQPDDALHFESTRAGTKWSALVRCDRERRVAIVSVVGAAEGSRARFAGQEAPLVPGVDQRQRAEVNLAELDSAAVCRFELIFSDGTSDLGERV